MSETDNSILYEVSVSSSSVVCIFLLCCFWGLITGRMNTIYIISIADIEQILSAFNVLDYSRGFG